MEVSVDSLQTFLSKRDDEGLELLMQLNSCGVLRGESPWSGDMMGLLDSSSNLYGIYSLNGFSELIVCTTDPELSAPEIIGVAAGKGPIEVRGSIELCREIAKILEVDFSNHGVSEGGNGHSLYVRYIHPDMPIPAVPSEGWNFREVDRRDVPFLLELAAQKRDSLYRSMAKMEHFPNEALLSSLIADGKIWGLFDRFNQCAATLCLGLLQPYFAKMGPFWYFKDDGTPDHYHQLLLQNILSELSLDAMTVLYPTHPDEETLWKLYDEAGFQPAPKLQAMSITI